MGILFIGCLLFVGLNTAPPGGPLQANLDAGLGIAQSVRIIHRLQIAVGEAGDLQQRLAAGHDDEAVRAVAFGPQGFDLAGQRIGVPELAAQRAIGADRIGVAKNRRPAWAPLPCNV